MLAIYVVATELSNATKKFISRRQKSIPGVWPEEVKWRYLKLILVKLPWLFVMTLNFQKCAAF